MQKSFVITLRAGFAGLLLFTAMLAGAVTFATPSAALPSVRVTITAEVDPDLGDGTLPSLPPRGEIVPSPCPPPPQRLPVIS